jgi:ribosome maturation factor RimP
MRERIDGQGFFKGTIAGVEDGLVIIDGDDSKRHCVPLTVITRANLEVEF